MWVEENNTLKRAFEFKDFSEAFAFMTRVALLAEKYDLDVKQIVLEKMEKNARKYPVEKSKGSAKKYTEL